MDLGLQGRRALVTGGTKGIGQGIARALASEGAAVIICGRDAAQGEQAAAALRAEKLDVRFAAADMESDNGVDALARAVLANGGVDILVNNVGGSANPAGAGRHFFDIPSSEWAATFILCVGGAVRLINHLAPPMRERGWGRIINISSSAGLEPGDDVPPEYAAAKAAMNTMTMSLSHSLARTGVTVNAVTPGPILTAGFQGWLDQLARDNGWGEEQEAKEAMFLKNFMKLSARRLGRPEDIGAAVAFVASKHGDFITGSNFRVDGGLSRAAV